jgi:hypothetical protein
MNLTEEIGLLLIGHSFGCLTEGRTSGDFNIPQTDQSVAAFFSSVNEKDVSRGGFPLSEDASWLL